MTRATSGGNRWADHYTRKAKQDGYAARSVYKLEEIQARHRILRPGDRVLDLGCAPGSWLVFAARIVGPQGRVVGLDLKPVTIALPAQVRTLVADLQDNEAALGQTGPDGFDVVLSDMAPATTGTRTTDAARSLDLAMSALAVARTRLKPGGCFVCKIFQGPDAKIFEAAVHRLFRETRLFKPQSSRKASREIFVIGKGKRQEE
ncbi:MAG: RlmE family RNA methyltransferase [Desulfobacteraceae bacterium]|jgi:23S rRNA (uridine2552-2'-O)-methyltransferase|nr:RlmE family RNA methyltransferase [Desulfobacteraceae bacterium]